MFLFRQFFLFDLFWTHGLTCCVSGQCCPVSMTSDGEPAMCWLDPREQWLTPIRRKVWVMRKTSVGMNRLPCACSFVTLFVSAKAANVSGCNRATMTMATLQINVKQGVSEVFLLCFALGDSRDDELSSLGDSSRTSLLGWPYWTIYFDFFKRDGRNDKT